jgi:polysaccharide export outer membrane protein
VDKEGNIDFPQIGSIKAAGKTTDELKNDIEMALKPFLNDPAIQVRFFNFRVTLMGEVNKPGTYIIPTERISILDAIGQAGDLTVYANRANLLLIREQEGKREYVRLNLQDRNIFNSPYFYLVQNDLIYIEPVELKTASIRDQSQSITPWISVVGTVVSLIISIISLTK